MTTEVLIDSDDLGLLIPSVRKLELVENSEVAFVSRSVDAVLRFSKRAASVVTPAPDSDVSLSPGGRITFKFIAAAPGTYCVFLSGLEDQTTEPECPEGESGAVLMIVSAGQVSFPVGDTTTQSRESDAGN